jgi:5-methylcytosine-specific restriction endonuclease McrA
MKTCAACGRELPADAFYASGGGRPGLRQPCRTCIASKAAARKAERSAWARAHYRKNREAIAAYQRTYYRANRERVIARVRARYEADPEPQRAWQRAYQRRRPDVSANTKHRRRALLRGATAGSVDARAVFLRDGGVCYLCGQPVDPTASNRMERPSLDHVVPLARGGPHTLDNVRLAHYGCNLRKGVRAHRPAP